MTKRARDTSRPSWDTKSRVNTGFAPAGLAACRAGNQALKRANVNDCAYSQAPNAGDQRVTRLAGSDTVAPETVIHLVTGKIIHCRAAPRHIGRLAEQQYPLFRLAPRQPGRPAASPEHFFPSALWHSLSNRSHQTQCAGRAIHLDTAQAPAAPSACGHRQDESGYHHC
jgi:hypothetical protein